jgi:hypothetical protein
VVFADGTGEYHPHEVRRENGFTVCPGCQPAKRKQHQQEVLHLEFRGSSTERSEEPWGHPRQDADGDRGDKGKCERTGRERREDQPECDDGSQVGDEARRKNGLPEPRAVAPEFEHDGVDDGD